MSEWKVSFRDDLVSLSTIMLVYRVVGMDVEVMHPGDNGQMMLSIQSPLEPTKPFMVLSNMMAKEFMQSLSEALDNKGIKPDSNAKIEGTLEATKSHLADLRQLLKLK